MLVNNAYDLQNIRNNPSGSYALGRNITDVSSTIPNFEPIPYFTGVFDGRDINGNSQTIGHLTIDRAAHNVGLFRVIGSDGVVRNLNLTDFSVSAGAGCQGGRHAGRH